MIGSTTCSNPSFVDAAAVLCHLFVCLQVLLQEREQEQVAQQLQQDLQRSAEGSAAAAGGDSSQQQGKQGKSRGPLRALILTPTRELALQVRWWLGRGPSAWGCEGLRAAAVDSLLPGFMLCWGCVCCLSGVSLPVSLPVSPCLSFIITVLTFWLGLDSLLLFPAPPLSLSVDKIVAVLLPALCLLQVCEHLQALGKQVGLRVIALVGGIAPVKQVGGPRFDF